jgi:prepilin-type N-terminal cleavage/methylation domain-containing protein
MATTKQRGFSLLELMIVITFSLIMGGITYMAMNGFLVQGHVSRAYETTFMALRNTRNLAITQQHEYYVVFYGSAGPGAPFPAFPAGTILVMYQPPAVAGVLPALQQVITYTIPSDTSFAVSTAVGFPTGAANTPDSFGTGVAPIDFGQGLGAGSLQYVVFFPDGSSQDDLGNYNSGIIYLTDTGATGMAQLLATRAITVWGATGRVRGWTLRQTGAATSEWAEQ